METATLINNGEDQVIRLPPSFHFKGERVYLKRMGSAIMLIPEQGSWDLAVEALKDFTEDFMSDRNQPPNQERPGLVE